MKPNKIIIALLPLLAFSCSTVQQEEKPKKQYTIAQFMDIVQLSGGTFSSDDSKILVSTKETGIFNAFEIDLKSGEKKQLTTSTDDAIFARSYFPGDDRLIYTSDKGGNEITHIYVRNNNGSTVDLIQDTTAKAQYYGWKSPANLFI